jgi:hypothetical protein
LKGRTAEVKFAIFTTDTIRRNEVLVEMIVKEGAVPRKRLTKASDNDWTPRFVRKTPN